MVNPGCRPDDRAVATAALAHSARDDDEPPAAQPPKRRWWHKG